LTVSAALTDTMAPFAFVGLDGGTLRNGVEDLLLSEVRTTEADAACTS
jgi:hypothetical protein